MGRCKAYVCRCVCVCNHVFCVRAHCVCLQHFFCVKPPEMGAVCCRRRSVAPGRGASAEAGEAEEEESLTVPAPAQRRGRPGTDSLSSGELNRIAWGGSPVSSQGAQSAINRRHG